MAPIAYATVCDKRGRRVKPMGMKWKKLLRCKNCKRQYVKLKRIRWDGFLKDETSSYYECLVCGGSEIEWVKASKEVQELEVDFEKGIKLLVEIAGSIFPQKVGWNITTNLYRIQKQFHNEPYSSDNYQKGMMVPTKTGYQATGLSYSDFQKSEWKPDFTVEEYRQWREKWCE